MKVGREIVGWDSKKQDLVVTTPVIRVEYSQEQGGVVAATEAAAADVAMATVATTATTATTTTAPIITAFLCFLTNLPICLHCFLNQFLQRTISPCP